MGQREQSRALPLGSMAAVLARARKRILRHQSHLVFGTECSTNLHVRWLPQEVPIHYSRTAPLPAVRRNELEHLLPDSGPYLLAVDNGEAEGLLVCVDDRIVHSAFLMFMNKTTCLLGFDRRTGLLGNAYTVPVYRGRGCQARSTQMRVLMAARAGLTSVISETSPGNGASQRGLIKGGMMLLGTTRFVVVLNTLVLRLERASPRVQRVSICI